MKYRGREYRVAAYDDEFLDLYDAVDAAAQGWDVEETPDSIYFTLKVAPPELDQVLGRVRDYLKPYLRKWGFHSTGEHDWENPMGFMLYAMRWDRQTIRVSLRGNIQ